MFYHLIRNHRIGLMQKDIRQLFGYRFSCHTCRTGFNWFDAVNKH